MRNWSRVRVAGLAIAGFIPRQRVVHVDMVDRRVGFRVVERGQRDIDFERPIFVAISQ